MFLKNKKNLFFFKWGGGGGSANKLRTQVTFYDLLINCCYLTVASFSLFLPIRHVYL